MPDRPVADLRTGRRRLEIAGVAGSGKSTLTRTLLADHPDWRLADTLHTRLPSHWPYVARAVPRALPVVARSMRRRPGMSWDELKFVVYVAGWGRYLDDRHGSGVTILDQGPIFALARLLWSGNAFAKSRPFLRWAQETTERWADGLDAIAWLDAPDDVLRERIDGREQRHEAKGRPAKEALHVLAAHREAYEHVFSWLERLGNPPVHRFDSSLLRPGEIAEALSGHVGEGPVRVLTEPRRGLNVG